MTAQTTRRMPCIVCRQQNLTHETATVCSGCSIKLRAGKTLDSPRTYCMPNCVDTVVKFRLHKDHGTQWAFADEQYRYGPCREAELTPAPDPADAQRTRDYLAASIERSTA